MPFIASQGGAFGYGRPTPRPQQTIAGSIGFSAASSNVNLTVPASSDWAIGSGNFTIEWYQYLSNYGGAASWPRPFSLGSSLMVSEEGTDNNRTFYLWVGGGANIIASGITNLQSNWTHFALSRNGTALNVYQNGSTLGTLTTSYNFADSTSPLYIGRPATYSSATEMFKGFITNFRWTNGTAIYTAPFNRPAAPLAPAAGTKLLLLAATSAGAYSDSSGLSKTVTNSNTSWSSNSPFA
jgi:hypothetical protein